MSVPLENSQEAGFDQEKPEVTQDIVTETPQSIPETQEDPNWKAMREARKKERAERMEAQRKADEYKAQADALKAAMEAAFGKNAPPPQAYQEYYGNAGFDQQEESEDVRIEKKVNALLAQREQKAKQEAYEREMQEYPTKLARDFPDFHKVIADENLDYFDYHFPEVSRPLQRLPDGYDKWADIYRAVKKFVPNHANAKKEAQRAEQNQMKPKSISTQQLSQSGQGGLQPWQEVEQRRAANWERMQKLLKGVG